MKQFTYEYEQPDEYHFSLDSVELALKTAEDLKKINFEFSTANVLDLCAGCGVVGFDFHFYAPGIQKIDSIEVQDVYSSYFVANLEKVKSGQHRSSQTVFNFLNLNYNQLLGEESKEQYDLILCNPPYFQADQGKLSPSQFKNRCRFFLDSDFSTLFEAMLNVLKPGGLSYFLLRPLLEHNKNLLEDCKSLVANRAQIEVLDEVRGTSLVKLKKY